RSGTTARRGSVMTRPSTRMRPAMIAPVACARDSSPSFDSALLSGTVEDEARDLGGERRALFFILEPANEDDEHVRPIRKDDRRVVLNLRDFSGFVRHANTGWQPGGNAARKMLTFEDRDHFLAGGCVDGLAARDLL